MKSYTVVNGIPEWNVNSGSFSVNGDIPPPPPNWPAPLRDSAYHGIAGEIVNAIKLTTEADPAAILAQLVVSFGNLVGRGPYVVRGGVAHRGNLFAVIVGATSKARKGTSWACARNIVKRVDEEWCDRIQTGLYTAEGLITYAQDCGPDKRIFVVEPEFVSVLRRSNDPKNTLSPILRQGWDGLPLQQLTVKKKAAKGAHISVVGQITAEELKKNLSNTEQLNGFANRFLWICARRARRLAGRGTSLEKDEIEHACQLKDALERAQSFQEITFNTEAEVLWHEMYNGPLAIEHRGLMGSITARAESQVLRLALIYALMDGSSTIAVPHLWAAGEFWRYSEDSARYIFGDALGDKIADAILFGLREAGSRGMTRKDIYLGIFNKHQTADVIEQALHRLRSSQLVDGELEKTGGRPAMRWWALTQPLTRTVHA